MVKILVIIVLQLIRDAKCLLLLKIQHHPPTAVYLLLYYVHYTTWRRQSSYVHVCNAMMNRCIHFYLGISNVQFVLTSSCGNSGRILMLVEIISFWTKTRWKCERVKSCFFRLTSFTPQQKNHVSWFRNMFYWKPIY